MVYRLAESYLNTAFNSRRIVGGVRAVQIFQTSGDNVAIGEWIFHL